MKNLWLVLFVSLFVIGCKQSEKTPAEPISLYETELFKDVQMSGVFEDSKTFVDLVPTKDIAILEKEYLNTKDNQGFRLDSFVLKNFKNRSLEGLQFKLDTTRNMYEHISNMWNILKRSPDSVIANSSRIALPYKYVVPGGRFQEIYYWDSYFTLEGLLVDNEEEVAQGMVQNFAFLIDSLGFIPNGTRDYYKTRSQPPYFALMVDAIARDNNDLLVEYLPQMTKEYNYWMEGALPGDSLNPVKRVVNLKSGETLNRYWDSGQTPRPESYREDFLLAEGLESDSLKQRLYKNLRSAAASGWDFSSRWFGEEGGLASTETISILPVDLNCLLYFMEKSIARASAIKGDTTSQEHYLDLAEKRKSMIQAYFWNETEGYYFDYNIEDETFTPKLTLAGVTPLFFEIATPDQAEQVKNVIMNAFLKEGGLVTTLEHSGQQWDAPNGWAPLQWLAVNGLLNYGYVDEAKEIMNRWLTLNEKVYQNTGKMMEKYNVEDLSLLSGGGEYPTQDGFGWTNGVALGFKQILEDLEKPN
ncbi:MAG: trehalase family glycosidase [Bacteroidota bacterium]|uniref:Trehalase family glycosidase n=1 Tax=Flagellimonas okinawensis TaxID=3031324 RepID=A0ABT5XIS1_9FLAO|nr:trehalase family glycosidase [[Muricauda] okinawensis]MDF0705717.1 trehalase family glycosidase [[Muricauda] okinawensis]MEC8830880.1 trehalase family glycosidase [Bacteroidota bacterium]